MSELEETKSTCTCTSVQPWLISNQHSKDYTLLSAFIPSIKNKSIVELHGKTVVASQYGWLVVADSKDIASISLFNPFSLATIDLPRLDLFSEDLVRKKDAVYFVMTCAPDNNIDNNTNNNGRHCCVLVVTCKSIIMFCRPGYDNGWGMQPARVEIEGVSRELSIHSISTCNGTIYGVLNNYLELYLVKLIISNTNQQHDYSNDDGSDLLIIRLKYIGQWNINDSNSRSPCLQSQLMESCGELYFVMLFKGDHSGYECIEEVRVLKFVEKDDNADVVVVERLENRAFFVGYNSSFACYAPPDTTSTSTEGSLLKGNCVYITSGEGVNFVYRLQEHTLAPAPLLPKFMSGFWVTSATKKKRNVEGCKNCIAKSSSHVFEKKIEIPIYSFEEAAGDQARLGELLLELPTEIIALVAMCLRLSDYSSFRATCKKFRDLTPPLSHWSDASAKVKYLREQLARPWLIHFNNKDTRQCNLIDGIRATQSYVMTTPWDQSCANMDVACSRDGWLLMLGQAGDLFFYNPFDKVITEAKKPDDFTRGHIRCVGFSGVPKGPSDECTIVGLHHDTHGDLMVCSYVYGDKGWHSFSAKLHHPKQRFTPANNTPVYFKGAFYFLDVKGKLGKLSVMADGRRREWKVLSCKAPKEVLATLSYQLSTYLFECEGALWSVFVRHWGSWAKVFRLDYAKKRWYEDNSKLEKYMIFLSPRSSFVTLAPTSRPDFGGKLHFSRLSYGRHHDRFIIYDLRSRTPSKAPVDFSQTRELLGSAWIQPAWSSNEGVSPTKISSCTAIT